MPSAPWQITRDMFLSVDEATRLLDQLRQCETSADKSQRTAAATDRLIVEILVYSGLRNSELCRLRLQDAIVGTGRSCLEVVGTPRQDRSVFIPRALSEQIRSYVNDVRRALLPVGVDPQDVSQPLIFNDRGKPYERTALYRRVVRILTECGLGERASVQLLRHTYGYLAYIKTGGNLLFVQRQLGHAHPMVTAIYAQFADEDYAVLADRLSGSEVPKPKRPAKPRGRKKRSLTR